MNPTYLQTVPSSGSAEVPMNENNAAIEFIAVFAVDATNNAGLTAGYLGGRWAGFDIATGDVSLTDDDENYIVVSRSTGAVSVSTGTTNWNDADGYARIRHITTSGGIKSVTVDHRFDSSGIFAAAGGGAIDAMTFLGVIDCSSNPNYPAADAGDVYKISVAGKIGGGSGTNVEAGDTIYCTADGTASGTQAAVGAYWAIVQTNLDGAVIGPSSVTANNLALFDGTTGKLIKESTLTAALDTISSTQGTIFYRNASAWVALSPSSTAGDVLRTGGAGANPSWASIPFIATLFWRDVTINNDVIVDIRFSDTVIFQQHFAGSVAKARTASTGTAVFDVKKNNSSIGSITFTASATGVFSIVGTTTFTSSDYLSIIAPASADSTLADIGFAIRGTIAI